MKVQSLSPSTKILEFSGRQFGKSDFPVATSKISLPVSEIITAGGKMEKFKI